MNHVSGVFLGFLRFRPEGVALPSGKRIRWVTAPVFLATKLEAFDGRGRGDYLFSHDLEDLIAVMDGRDTVREECQRRPAPVRAYLAQRFMGLLAERDFMDALAGHLPGDAASQGRPHL